MHRLRLLEEWHDPQTFRHLDALGITRGWTCLEIGSGAGSVTRWLADRVGDQGRVEAVDLDPGITDPGGRRNVTVRKLDVEASGLPRDAFDLVHARFVLMHTTDTAAVLRRLRGALRPGGWLLAEDHDMTWLDLEEWPGYPPRSAAGSCEGLASAGPAPGPAWGNAADGQGAASPHGRAGPGTDNRRDVGACRRRRVRGVDAANPGDEPRLPGAGRRLHGRRPGSPGRRGRRGLVPGAAGSVGEGQEDCLMLVVLSHVAGGTCRSASAPARCSAT